MLAGITSSAFVPLSMLNPICNGGDIYNYECIWRDLRTLNLSLLGNEEAKAVHRFAKLPLLWTFLKTAKSHTALSLSLTCEEPHGLRRESEDSHDDDGYSLYKSTGVCPSLREVKLSCLHTLEIVALGITYHDLASLRS